MDFAPFDTRGYKTVSVVEGYGECAETYESVVCDEMDLLLLERVETVDWSQCGRAADLACGTGRTGAWLKRKGVRQLDGLDATPEMLARAEARGIYDTLRIGDLREGVLAAEAYGVVTAALVDEHLETLGPLYAEAARLAVPGGYFVIPGYHPHFVLKGIPTHFDSASGEPIAITTYVHLFSDHVHAAFTAGLSLAEMHEGIIDDAWIARKPKWEKYRNEPMSFCLVWRKGG